MAGQGAQWSHVKAMLILTRKLSESIVIDGRIVVTVMQVDRGSVKLGVDAPPEVAIHRLEVHEAIQRGDLPPPPRAERRRPVQEDNICPSE